MLRTLVTGTLLVAVIVGVMILAGGCDPTIVFTLPVG